MIDYWNKQEDEIVVKYYLEKDGIKTIERLLPNRKYNQIKGRANYLGFKRTGHLYKDENFFEIPNTINSSVSGFLAADGHINVKTGERKQFLVSFFQNTSDKEILEQIQKVTKSNYTVKTRVRKWRISINKKVSEGINSYSALYIGRAEKWIKDIVSNWNIAIGHKSYTLEAPKNLNNLDIKLAYIHGLISGDGTISLIKSTKKGRIPILRVSILGTLPLLEWIKNVYSEFLQERLDIKILRKKKSKCLHDLCVSGYKAIRLFEKMRSLNCIKLSRKWDNPDILSHIAEKRANPLFCQRLDNPKKSQQSLSHPPQSSVNSTEIFL